jgi:hypothetical protein
MPFKGDPFCGCYKGFYREEVNRTRLGGPGEWSPFIENSLTNNKNIKKCAFTPCARDWDANGAGAYKKGGIPECDLTVQLCQQIVDVQAEVGGNANIPVKCNQTVVRNKGGGGGGNTSRKRRTSKTTKLKKKDSAAKTDKLTKEDKTIKTGKVRSKKAIAALLLLVVCVGSVGAYFMYKNAATEGSKDAGAAE